MTNLFLRTLVFVLPFLSLADAALNVYGRELQPCSGDNMALTGFTRNSHCVDASGDSGSHNVCIDMKSTRHGNFCTVTGQTDWCDEYMPCDQDSAQNCPVVNWCVCEWAFATYLAKAGGCHKIASVICESTNEKVIADYENKIAGGDRDAELAFNCLKKKCGLGSSS